MQKGKYSSDEIRLRMNLIKSIRLAIREANILNRILDDQHEMLSRSSMNKAA